MTNEEFQIAVLGKLDNIDKKIDSIEKKLDIVHDQTANLTEFRTESNMKFDKVFEEVHSIRKDIANVEIITSSNWNEIAKIKAVK